MVVLANMWFSKLVRQFFYMIDRIVFNFIPAVYDLLISIARTSVLSQGDIASMADRIYKLLAVFMVFKVTFSLIMYVVNPDDFSDKSKGVGKLTTNIVISLALLILTPYIFRGAYELQTIILEDNSLATLVFGKDSNSTFLTTAGQDMAYITISPFFTPNVSIEKLYDCVDLVEKDSNGDVRVNPSCSGISSSGYDDLKDDTSMMALVGDNFEKENLINYVAGVENGSMPLMFREDMVTAADDDNEAFIMDYKWGISTVVGIVVALLLITFCMDVALRSIKLAFLQLIAPIPIISYVDPKSGKDGLFKKWYQMCFKTFLSLFVRLLALYFAVYIISRVADLKLIDIIDGSYVTNGYIAIFIIIGALMFAKQLPKILEGLGIKLDGDGKFFLNPLKKFSEQALGGKQILGAAKGAIAGGAIGTAGMLTGAGLSRGISGLAGGIKSGIQGKKMGEIRKNQATRNAEMRRAIAGGSTFGERVAARYSSFMGTPGRIGRIQHEKLDLQNKMDNNKARIEEIQGGIASTKRKIAERKKMEDSISSLENRAQSKIKNGEGKLGKEYLDLKAKYDYLASNGGSAKELADAEGEMNAFLTDVGMKKYMSNQARYVHAKADYDKAQKDFKENKITKKELDDIEKKYEQVKKDTDGDDAYDTMYKNYEVNAKAIGEELKEDGGDLHTQLGVSKGKSGDLSREIIPDENRIQQIQDENTAMQSRISVLNAEERDAQNSIKAVHGSENGPKNPRSITQADSTIGWRAGGYGPFTGPQGFRSGRPPQDGSRPQGPQDGTL